MLRRPKLYLAFAAVAALMAAIPATSSAASFGWSHAGEYATEPLETQVMTFAEEPYGSVECDSVGGVGAVSDTEFADFDLTVYYSDCQAFGFSDVELSPVTYSYHADGWLNMETPLTISVEVPIFPDCTVTVEPQGDMGAVEYTNKAPGRVIVEHAIEDIAFSSEGSAACPSSDDDATLTGVDELAMVSGGSVSWRNF